MTALGLGFWALAPKGAMLETPVPGEPDVALAVFAPLPKGFGERDRQRLSVAVRVLADGTQEYSRRLIFDVTDGRSVQAALLPDGVVLRLVAPKANLANAVAILEGLLRRPVVDATSLDRALRRIQRGEPGYWSAALRPERNDLKRITPAEARAVLTRVFDPARIAVAAVGGFEPGAPTRAWTQRTADWKPLPAPRYPDNSPAPEPTINPSGITTVELRGAPMSLNDPAFPARWLALIGLGVGKGSALFGDVRQVEAWSYRQEAILWPDPQGLVPRLVAAAAPEEGEAARAEGLRTTLRRAVGAWTEADRVRALGMASLVLEDGKPLGPLWMADAPVGATLADRAMLDAYWWAKGGVRWDAKRLLDSMRAVSLKTMKAEADALLADAKAIVLPGG